MVCVTLKHNSPIDSYCRRVVCQVMGEWGILVWLLSWQQIFCVAENLDEIRDSISADIAMRTTHRPVIYLFSQDLTSDLIPLIQSELKSYHLQCFDLLLTSKPEEDLFEFAVSAGSNSAGSIAIVSGIESLSGMKLSRLNFLHSISDSSSNSFGNLFVILVWNSLIQPFPSNREEFHSFLANGGASGTEGGEGPNLNTRALVGRISRLKSHPQSQLRTENSIPLLCETAVSGRLARGTGGGMGNDWTLVYLFSALIAIIGTLFFQCSSRSSSPDPPPAAPPRRPPRTPLQKSTSLPQPSVHVPSSVASPAVSEERHPYEVDHDAVLSKDREVQAVSPELSQCSEEMPDRPLRVRGRKKSKGSSTW
jgi:hypothetical protein